MQKRPFKHTFPKIKLLVQKFMISLLPEGYQIIFPTDHIIWSNMQNLESEFGGNLEFGNTNSFVLMIAFPWFCNSAIQSHHNHRFIEHVHSMGRYKLQTETVAILHLPYKVQTVRQLYRYKVQRVSSDCFKLVTQYLSDSITQSLSDFVTFLLIKGVTQWLSYSVIQ